MKTIDLLKERCSNLLAEEKKVNNTKKVTILTTISEILELPSALKKLDAEIVLNMLRDLGFSPKEIPAIYSALIQEK